MVIGPTVRIVAMHIELHSFTADTSELCRDARAPVLVVANIFAVAVNDEVLRKSTS
jgi:hypothetical protein